MEGFAEVKKLTSRTRVFKMRISREDEKYFDALAEKLARSRADAIRFIVRVTVDAINRDGGLRA